MPLSTATPNRAIKPTPAEMLKGMSRSHSANTPPIMESGTAVEIIKAYFRRSKVKKSKAKINNKATGTATFRRWRAFSRFSNCPP